MVQTKTIKHNNEEFLLIFTEDKWWYIGKQIADYLEYNETRNALKPVNDIHKITLKKKGNEEIFSKIFEVTSFENDTSKIPNISLVDEDGLIILALNSTKPNAELLVQEMIKVFKVELDKAGINALEMLTRIEMDNNILINARATKYYNEGHIKYNQTLINKAINELLFYKYFPDEHFGNDINTDKLRQVISIDTELAHRDVSYDRYEVGNSLLELMNSYYLLNEEPMNLRRAKYIYVKNNNYKNNIIQLTKERFDKIYL